MNEFEFELKDGAYTLKKYHGTATQVVIPSTYNGRPVTGIGNQAFYAKEKLADVKIPHSVAVIGSSAFSACCSLEAVTLSASLKSIGFRAFAECAKLASVVIPDDVTTVEDCAFAFCGRLKSVTIGKNVTFIGHSAFMGCRSLTSLIFQRPYGWFTSSRTGTSGISQPPEKMSNPELAAHLLSKERYETYWKRRTTLDAYMLNENK